MARQLQLRPGHLSLLLLIGALALGMAGEPAPLQGAEAAAGFVEVAPQGFGDRQNSWAWSMQWWRGHLYVGTNRAWRCAEILSIHNLLPRLFPYPPEESHLDCQTDPADLPLQAEIWRLEPQRGGWERVYQAPETVELPDRPGSFIARDVGYRGMNVFVESDGTEALYVTSVSPRFLNLGPSGEMPPPRILRSTDGVTFEPVPQEPESFLGRFPFSSLRNQFTFDGRFYTIGAAVQGSGVLLEAAHPAGGNDNFRQVSPEGLVVSVAHPFNGQIYLGLRDVARGYSVIRTSAVGTAPYTYTTVVPQGAFVFEDANPEALSMVEFQGRLYVGGNSIFGSGSAAELIRINPDDSWEVVAGVARLTPDGWKFPISGKTSGFGNTFNGHMWRMAVFEGQLYVGTFDSSTLFRDNPSVEPYLRTEMGFDLYRSADGVSFERVTRNGLGDPFSFGVRSLEATPAGLFLGSANSSYGLRIWRLRPGAAAPGQPLYLPLL